MKIKMLKDHKKSKEYLSDVAKIVEYLIKKGFKEESLQEDEKCYDTNEFILKLYKEDTDNYIVFSYSLKEDNSRNYINDDITAYVYDDMFICIQEGCYDLYHEQWYDLDTGTYMGSENTCNPHTARKTLELPEKFTNWVKALPYEEKE